MKKRYKSGITIGILSILSSLIIVGIPIGNNILEIINIIFYITGLLIILYLNFIKKNNKYLLIFTIIYLIILTTMIGIIELKYNNYNLLTIGFSIGLILSIIGLINSNKNKNKYNIKSSIIINVIALIISILSFIMIFINNSLILENTDNCDNMTGGGYNIYFNTNSDRTINSMHVCIACSPDTYEKLPTPTKDGYIFSGWYYDKKLKNKVNVSSTIDISPIPDKDKTGCLIGYKDINLYAKWNKIG